MTSQFREGEVTDSESIQQLQRCFELVRLSSRCGPHDAHCFPTFCQCCKGACKKYPSFSAWNGREVTFPLESGLPQPEVFLTEPSDATLSINDASTSESMLITSPQVLTLQEEQFPVINPGISSLPLQRFAFSTDKQFQLSQENQSQSLFSPEEGTQFLSLGKQQCENEEMVDPSHYNNFFNRIFHQQVQEQDRLDPLLGPLTPLEECERNLEECEIGTHKEEILFTLDQMREIRRGVDLRRLSDECSLSEVQELSDSVVEYQDAFDALVNLVKTGDCNCEECTGEEPITLYTDCEPDTEDDSSNSEDDENDDEESPQCEKEVIMSAGTKVEVGVLPGGFKKKKGRRSKRPKGRKRTGKRRRNGRRSTIGGIPLHSVIRLEEMTKGLFTNVGSNDCSINFGLTVLGGTGLLTTTPMSQFLGETQLPNLYTKARVERVTVRITWNNSEVFPMAVYAYITNVPPTNNAAVNYLEAHEKIPGRLSRVYKFVMEHSGLLAAQGSFSFSVSPKRIYGNPTQYEADSNTMIAITPNLGGVPTYSAPNNNVFLVIGAQSHLVANVFTAAGVRFNCTMIKTVHLWEKVPQIQ